MLNAGELVEPRGLSFIADRTLKWYQNFGKLCASVFVNLNIHLTI